MPEPRYTRMGYSDNELFRVLWSNGNDHSCEITTQTLKDAQLILRAYHELADAIGLDKSMFEIQECDGCFWETIIDNRRN